MWWCHDARNREMSCARREPPSIDRNAPRRRIPMKPAGDLVDHQGFIVGIVETQVTCPEFELAGRLRKHPIGLQTDAELA